MPERSPLAPRLRELDDTLGERGMPPGARARVEARLQREAQRRAAISGFRLRWLPALTFAAGAALVLAVVGLRFSSDDSVDTGMQQARVMGMFTVQGEGCRHEQDARDTVFRGTCRLVSSQMAVHTWEQVRMREDDGAVRLREGTAMFDIETVEAGEPPTRIHVSHGVIEVLGTRFTIEQSPRGGHVDLFEGRIRFVALDGTTTEIAPGQRYTWGETIAALTLTPPPAATSAAGGSASGQEEAAVADVPTPDESVTPSVEPLVEPEPARERTRHRSSRARKNEKAEPSNPSGSADEAAAIIEEVARLRGQGRYTDAVGVLRRAESARRWDRRTAQVLSYELGEIIERHLDDDAAACAHWARHQTRFGGGRYARAVQSARERLGCESAP